MDASNLSVTPDPAPSAHHAAELAFGWRCLGCGSITLHDDREASPPSCDGCGYDRHRPLGCDRVRRPVARR